MEATESGTVRIVNDGDLSSSALLGGRQNESAVHLRENIVRKS